MLNELGKAARRVSVALALLSLEQKNAVLIALADLILHSEAELLDENRRDGEASKDQLSEAMLDRLRLNPQRLADIAQGLREVAAQPDPIGQIQKAWTLDNGVTVQQVSVPLGVVAMIYESRPNVTVDSFALTFKSGNALILKGGKEALHTNMVFERLMHEVLRQQGIDPLAVQLIKETDREVTRELMHLDGYVDVLIPRGSAQLIAAVKKEASIPVIETGAGNCFAYVDVAANQKMALDIIVNAKCQRVSVCNSLESIIVHQAIAEEFIPQLVQALDGVEIYGDAKSRAIDAQILAATEEDYYREYLDYKVSLMVAQDLDEAITWVNRYHTQHSDAIITENTQASGRFTREVDSAVVLVNTSPRFTDGFVFGFGSEIGISTQKLHVRGPMGLQALTSYKYILQGKGQIR